MSEKTESPMTIDSILRSKGRGVITVEAETPVGTTLCTMRHKKIGAVVVSRTGRDVEGLVCEQDLVRALKSYGVSRLMYLTVGEIMRRDVVTCRPEEGLRRVMTRMIAKRTPHMPVINGNGVCGIVSLADVLKQRLRDAEAEVEAESARYRIPAALSV
jgi:CBS domain-containing protein